MSFTLNTAAALLPANSCYPATAQGMLNLVADNLLITGLDALNTFNYGPNTPSANLQDRPWIKTDAQYKLIGLYTFTSGSWQPAQPATIPGTIVDFFGSSSSIVSPWYLCNGQVVTGPVGGSLTTPNLSGLITLGAGTNPATGTNFAYGSTGGEEKHALVSAENGPHTHPPLSAASTGFWTYLGAITQTFIGTGSGATSLDATTGTSGNGTPHNNIQPYMALYKIIYWP